MKGVLLRRIAEVERQADWGGVYSIYSVDAEQDDRVPPGRRELARRQKNLTLWLWSWLRQRFFYPARATTTRGLKRRGESLKSQSGRLTQAKELLAELKRISVPIPLPDNV